MTTPTSPTPSEVPTEKNVVTASNMDYEATLKNTAAVIKNSQEFKECMAPAVNMCENSVGMRIAQEKKSVDICNELTQEANRESCTMVIVSLLAQEKNDINACNSLSDASKYACRTQYIHRNAVSLKSTQECEKIATEGKQSALSGEILPLNTNTSIDQCKMEVLRNKETTTVQDCDIFSDTMMKRICSDTITHREDMQKMMSEMKPEVPSNPEIQ